MSVDSAALAAVLALPADDPLAHMVHEAVDVIERALDEHGEEHLALSFNGGKDCTVLLHLFAAVLVNRHHALPLPPSSANPTVSPIVQTRPTPHVDALLGEGANMTKEELSAELESTKQVYLKQQRTSSSAPSPPSATPTSSSSAPPPPLPPIKSLYVSHDSPFPSMESFVDLAATQYNLSLTRIVGLGMKRALEAYHKEHEEVKAILIGTRRGDPHGANLAHMQPTDPTWPPFMRVHPVINWSYSDVWAFLRRFDVPYCELYDRGYTSLGSTYNTFPNPALKIEEQAQDQDGEMDGAACARFRPAFELRDESLERAGRDDRWLPPKNEAGGPAI